MLSTDPSGLYYGSNASNLVTVVADDATINDLLSAARIKAPTVSCNNLFVDNEATIQNVVELNVEDTIIQMGTGNTAGDTLLTGILNNYTTSGVQKKAGLLRIPATGEFVLLKDGTDSAMTGSVGADLGLATLYSVAIVNNNDTSTGSLHVTNDTQTGSLHVTNNMTYTGEILGDHSIIDDGTGTLTNDEINTVSLNASGTSIIDELKVIGEALFYDGIPFTDIHEDSVPTTMIDGLGVQTPEVFSINTTSSVNPLMLIPFIDQVPGAPGPYAYMSGLGNITAKGAAGVGGNITASGKGQFGTMEVSGGATFDARVSANTVIASGIPLINSSSGTIDPPYVQLLPAGNIDVKGVGETNGNITASGTGKFKELLVTDASVFRGDITMQATGSDTTPTAILAGTVSLGTPEEITSVIGNFECVGALVQLGHPTIAGNPLAVPPTLAQQSATKVYGRIVIRGPIVCGPQSINYDAGGNYIGLNY